MKALLDINVVLDVLLVRQPWFADASQDWDVMSRAGLRQRWHRSPSPPSSTSCGGRPICTMPTMPSTSRLNNLEILPVQRSTLEQARTLSGSDYEDNVQLACAIEAKMDCLVTRDPSGYPGAALPVLTPAQLVAQLAQGAP